MPQTLSQGEGSAFLVPADGAALALRYGETWIGRGSFPLSPAAQLLCSRRQACLRYGISGLKIECHGLNPICFLTCQHANFQATQEAHSLHKLCKGQSTWLADGDRFYLIGTETLLRVVIESMRGVSAPDSMEVPPMLRSSMSHRNQTGGMLKDMQSVVATVTGYEGLERTKLIKLINKTGSAFTGKWTPKHTHLVCWKFAGAKYEMAKMSGKTILLNHRWFEDCLKANCRLPEQPYTLESGEEVGPLLWNDMLEEGGGKNIIEVSGEARSSGQPLSVSTNIYEPPEERDQVRPSEVHTDVQVEHAECSTKVKKKRKDTASSSRRSFTDQNVHESPLTLADHGHSLQQEGQPRPPRNKSRRLVRNQEQVEAIAAEGMVRAGFVIDLCTPPELSPNINVSVPPVLELAENSTVSGSPEYRTFLPGADGCGQLCDAFLHAGIVPEEGPATKQSPSGSQDADVACVICYEAKKLDKEAILDCGHKFCFECIHKWSLEATIRDPLCPLCKAPFNRIVRRNRTSPKDGKLEDAGHEEFFVGVQSGNEASIARDWACITCHSSDSQDLFCTCNGCSQRAIHVFCIDPPGTTVHDDWLCPRCTMHRNRAQNVGDWRRILPGNDADGSGGWHVSRLDGQPVSRAMRSIDMQMVNSRQAPNPSVNHATMNRPRVGSHHGRLLLPRPSRRRRQQRMSSFLIRQADQL